MKIKMAKNGASHKKIAALRLLVMHKMGIDPQKLRHIKCQYLKVHVVKFLLPY